MKFKLTIFWDNAEPITSYKEFKNRQLACRWREICTDICGTSYIGEPWVRTELERLDTGKGNVKGTIVELKNERRPKTK